MSVVDSESRRFELTFSEADLGPTSAPVFYFRGFPKVCNFSFEKLCSSQACSGRVWRVSLKFKLFMEAWRFQWDTRRSFFFSGDIFEIQSFGGNFAFPMALIFSLCFFVVSFSWLFFVSLSFFFAGE